MIAHSHRVAAAAVALLVALGGCTSKPARYYALSSSADPTTAPLAVAVAVGPVSIPALVDSPMIMESVGVSEIRPNDFERWAAPLRDNIAHAVAGDLAALLGTARVTLAAATWSETPDYRVAIEIERFESAPGQAATLDAVWTVRRSSDAALRSGRTTVREETRGADMNALVAAHSRALARLSEDIAGAIRKLSGT